MVIGTRFKDEICLNFKLQEYFAPIARKPQHKQVKGTAPNSRAILLLYNLIIDVACLHICQVSTLFVTLFLGMLDLSFSVVIPCD